MKLNSREILEMAPVVPVITITDIDTAVPLARALMDGGIPVLEVTLRTEHALDAIRLIKEEVDGAVVGAGTIINTQTLDAALQAGSEFIITPGLTDSLLAAGVKCGVPFMPGIATVSDLMRCLEAGINIMKFFPAEANGGAKALKAFAGPFSDVAFCPTGGISLANMGDYLKLPSVLSVGGSWICPNDLIAAGEWQAITDLAAEATEKVNSIRSGK